ncbi:MULTISPECIES: hypothetical protein [unclassified Spirillospora]|uniref:hypothetical protein n=1 Tax=unclassified Spirillospora TaxID=2642701 RepID=UPI00371BF025
MARPPLLATLALLPAAAMTLAACGSDDANPSAARTTASASATPAATTSAPPPPPAAEPPSIATAADGRKLSACKDGECEVIVEEGDVLRFGDAVQAEPEIDRLTVVGMGEAGPVLALPSGMTTTANGGIEINGGLSIESGVPEKGRVAIRISRIG